MATSLPVLEALGAAVAVASDATIVLEYPASIAANDILIAHIVASDGLCFYSSNTGGFTVLASVDNGSTASHFYLIKRATGSESGDFAVVLSHVRTIYGRVARISGCRTTGDPYEDYVTHANSGAEATITLESITTYGKNRLLLAMAQVSDNVGLSSGASDYTQQYYVTTSIGADGALYCATQDAVISDIYAQDSITIDSSAEGWASLVIALVPEGSDFTPTMIIF